MTARQMNAKRRCLGMDFKDTLERWQDRIFKVVLFILFLAAAYKLLDSELHLTRVIYLITGH